MKNYKKIFLEDVSYGIYDRPIESREDEFDEKTVPSEIPIEASSQMATQLSVDRPPIEDEEYLPASVDELSRAASAISKLVPVDKVESFYRSLHDLLEKTMDEESEVSSEPVEVPTEVSERKNRAKINRVISEMVSDDDVAELDAYRGRSYDTGGVDYFGDYDAAPEGKTEKSSGGYSLDDIADEMGYSGASGVRQEIQRLLGRLQYFVVNVDPSDLESLKDFAANEYIDIMQSGDFGLDDADIADLKSNVAAVKSLDTFRYFFVMNFVIPAYRQVVREATRRLNSEIDALGLPDDMKQTVYNQASGLSKEGTIAKKLASKVKAEEITKEEALELVRKIESAMPGLKDSSEKTSDLVQISLDKWSGLGKKRKARALTDAMGASMQG